MRMSTKRVLPRSNSSVSLLDGLTVPSDTTQRKKSRVTYVPLIVLSGHSTVGSSSSSSLSSSSSSSSYDASSVSILERAFLMGLEPALSIMSHLSLPDILSCSSINHLCHRALLGGDGGGRSDEQGSSSSSSGGSAGPTNLWKALFLHAHHVADVDVFERWASVSEPIVKEHDDEDDDEDFRVNDDDDDDTVDQFNCNEEDIEADIDVQNSVQLDYWLRRLFFDCRYGPESSRGAGRLSLPYFRRQWVTETQIEIGERHRKIDQMRGILPREYDVKKVHNQDDLMNLFTEMTTDLLVLQESPTHRHIIVGRWLERTCSVLERCRELSFAFGHGCFEKPNKIRKDGLYNKPRHHRRYYDGAEQKEKVKEMIEAINILLQDKDKIVSSSSSSTASEGSLSSTTTQSAPTTTTFLQTSTPTVSCGLLMSTSSSPSATTPSSQSILSCSNMAEACTLATRIVFIYPTADTYLLASLLCILHAMCDGDYRGLKKVEWITGVETVSRHDNDGGGDDDSKIISSSANADVPHGEEAKGGQDEINEEEVEEEDDEEDEEEDEDDDGEEVLEPGTSLPALPFLRAIHYLYHACLPKHSPNIDTDFSVVSAPKLLTSMTKDEHMMNAMHAILRAGGATRAHPSAVEALFERLRMWLKSAIEKAVVIQKTNGEGNSSDNDEDEDEDDDDDVGEHEDDEDGDTSMVHDVEVQDTKKRAREPHISKRSMYISLATGDTLADGTGRNPCRLYHHFMSGIVSNEIPFRRFVDLYYTRFEEDKKDSWDYLHAPHSEGEYQKYEDNLDDDDEEEDDDDDDDGDDDDDDYKEGEGEGKDEREEEEEEEDFRHNIYLDLVHNGSQEIFSEGIKPSVLVGLVQLSSPMDSDDDDDYENAEHGVYDLEDGDPALLNMYGSDYQRDEDDGGAPLVKEGEGGNVAPLILPAAHSIQDITSGEIGPERSSRRRFDRGLLRQIHTRNEEEARRFAHHITTIRASRQWDKMNYFALPDLATPSNNTYNLSEELKYEFEDDLNWHKGEYDDMVGYFRRQQLSNYDSELEMDAPYGFVFEYKGRGVEEIIIAANDRAHDEADSDEIREMYTGLEEDVSRMEHRSKCPAEAVKLGVPREQVYPRYSFKIEQEVRAYQELSSKNFFPPEAFHHFIACTLLTNNNSLSSLSLPSSSSSTEGTSSVKEDRSSTTTIQTAGGDTPLVFANISDHKQKRASSSSSSTTMLPTAIPPGAPPTGSDPIVICQGYKVDTSVLDMLAESSQDYLCKLVQDSVLLCAHAGRDFLLAEDVQLAHAISTSSSL
eukprot:TRINITY_DN5838_c0_g2_i3.p1 TRINITY_DN5838_c0_g2~~TRINITY_DN5838_c0_g2_i3.p1  ORF type:complete len:1292 (+),score=366.97 TRINITY_DN5838_c0_g2_i3:63-3938(+)